MVTKILTSTDGSAGRDKSQLNPVASLAYEVAAAEWNNVKNAVVEILGTLGKSDGSTAGVLRDLLAMRGPRSTSIGVFEDFDDRTYLTGGTVWKATTAGTGACSLVQGTATGDGFGSVRCAVGAGAGSALFENQQRILSPVLALDLRWRFKTPTVLANLTGYAGWANGALSSRATLGWDASGNLLARVASATGGADSGNVDTGVDVTGGVWYEGRVVIVDGASTTLYLNDVQVYQNVSATQRLRSGDVFSWVQRVDFAAGAGGQLDVDWYEIRGTRK